MLTDLPCVCVDDVSKRLSIEDGASSIRVRLLPVPRLLLPSLGIQGLRADLPLLFRES